MKPVKHKQGFSIEDILERGEKAVPVSNADAEFLNLSQQPPFTARVPDPSSGLQHFFDGGLLPTNFDNFGHDRFYGTSLPLYEQMMNMQKSGLMHSGYAIGPYEQSYLNQFGSLVDRGYPQYQSLYNSPYPGLCYSVCGSKRKGGQIRFTPQQTKSLESRFANTKYLTPEDRRHLAIQLKLSDRQVKTWFQNRRAKWRRFHGGNNLHDLDGSLCKSSSAEKKNISMEDSSDKCVSYDAVEREDSTDSSNTDLSCKNKEQL